MVPIAQRKRHQQARALVMLMAVLLIPCAWLCFYADGAQAKGYKDVTGKVDFVQRYTPVFSNGKTYFYTISGEGKTVLYKKSTRGGKAKAVKKFKDYYSVSYVYGNKVFLTHQFISKKTSFLQDDTYIYNLKSGKVKKVKAKCKIVAANGGKYVVGNSWARSEVGPLHYTLYKIKGSKLKKVKLLANYGSNIKFVGGYFYYGRSSDGYLLDLSIYRCKANGTKVKKLGGPWHAEDFVCSQNKKLVPIFDSAQSCVFADIYGGPGCDAFRFNYKTNRVEWVSYGEYRQACADYSVAA